MDANLGLTIVCLLLIAKEVLYTFWNVKRQSEMTASMTGLHVVPPHTKERPDPEMWGQDEPTFTTLGLNRAPQKSGAGPSDEQKGVGF